MAKATPTCSKFFLFLVATWFGQLRGGALRYLGFASSRAAKIYGDLAKIYGASPQFFATVSGLTLEKGHKGLMPIVTLGILGANARAYMCNRVGIVVG